MRLIGHLDGEAVARKFGNYLFVQGIENEIESDQAEGWGVWIRAEEDLNRAKALLASFRENPDDPRFESTEQAVRELREQKEKEQADYERRMKGRRDVFRPLTNYGFGPLTFALICGSVLVFILSKFGRDTTPVDALFISDYDIRGSQQLNILKAFAAHWSAFGDLLPEIRRGQVWRLFTPMFVHFDFLHIFFNMLWLRDLGSMIERRQSTWLFAIMVLVISAVSNVAQFMVFGPVFGGMSGVVYGLMGYIWIRGKLDPGSGLFLHPSTVTLMIIWLFAGIVGILGPIANVVHTVGLLMGMAWGYLSSLRRR